MKYKKKPFSEKLHAQDDTAAKKALSKFFPKDGVELKEPPSQYDVDFFLVKNKKKVANLEVEVKHAWDQKEYPYEDVRYAYRKKKFCNEKTFFVFNLASNIKGVNELVRSVWC